MSRSKRKKSITGITTCRSERADKKTWHKLWRTKERSNLAALSPEEQESYLIAHPREVSNVWCFGKDGKHYHSKRDYLRWAQVRADHLGGSPKECAALGKRLLHKLMGK